MPARLSYKRIDPDVPKALDFVCDLMRSGKVPTELFLTHQWHFDEVPKAFPSFFRATLSKVSSRFLKSKRGYFI